MGYRAQLVSLIAVSLALGLQVGGLRDPRLGWLGVAVMAASTLLIAGRLWQMPVLPAESTPSVSRYTPAIKVAAIAAGFVTVLVLSRYLR